MLNFKNKQLVQQNKKIQTLLEKLMNQFSAVAQSLEERHINQHLFDEMQKREEDINNSEEKILNSLVSSVILFNPKAADLRRIVSTHEVIMYMERTANMLLEAVEQYEKITRDDDDAFIEIELTLLKLLSFIREITSEAIISHLQEDGETAHKVISKGNIVDAFFAELTTKLASSLKIVELSEQNLTDIIKYSQIFYNFKTIREYAINIAEAAIYLTEGREIRYTRKD